MADKSVPSWPANVSEKQRPSASKILPYLYVGNFASSANAKYLSDRNIKYILNVTPSPSCNVQPDIEYLSIPICCCMIAIFVLIISNAWLQEWVGSLRSTRQLASYTRELFNFSHFEDWRPCTSVGLQTCACSSSGTKNL